MGYADVVRSRTVAPAPEPLPADLARLDVPLVNGLPATIDLDAELSLVLVAPTGLAITWRDAPPDAVVSTSEVEREPLAEPAVNAPAAPVGEVERFPLRLVTRVGGALGATVPLAGGLERRVPDAGDAPVVAEVAILGWDVRAGTLRGPGDFGSRISLAWRRADGEHAALEPPAVHPRVRERLEGER